mmetsp:Transcript_21360/g.42418  ORF Transcript_21360/g.42418 Transcript_21360/m.42418 type:complete len:249 (-) Transcript_21360:222-968(-)
MLVSVKLRPRMPGETGAPSIAISSLSPTMSTCAKQGGALDRYCVTLLLQKLLATHGESAVTNRNLPEKSTFEFACSSSSISSSSSLFISSWRSDVFTSSGRIDDIESPMDLPRKSNILPDNLCCVSSSFSLSSTWLSKPLRGRTERQLSNASICVLMAVVVAVVVVLAEWDPRDALGTKLDADGNNVALGRRESAGGREPGVLLFPLELDLRRQLACSTALQKLEILTCLKSPDSNLPNSLATKALSH